MAAMSAIGPKRTWLSAPHMSAFGGKADMTVCGCLLSRSLLGLKRTWALALHTSAFDPKRTCGGMRWPVRQLAMLLLSNLAESDNMRGDGEPRKPTAIVGMQRFCERYDGTHQRLHSRYSRRRYRRSSENSRSSRAR